MFFRSDSTIGSTSTAPAINKGGIHNPAKITTLDYFKKGEEEETDGTWAGDADDGGGRTLGVDDHELVAKAGGGGGGEEVGKRPLQRVVAGLAVVDSYHHRGRLPRIRRHSPLPLTRRYWHRKAKEWERTETKSRVETNAVVSTATQ